MTKLPKRWISCLPIWCLWVIGSNENVCLSVLSLFACIQRQKCSGVRASCWIEPPISWLSWGDPTHSVHWPGIFDQLGKSKSLAKAGTSELRIPWHSGAQGSSCCWRTSNSAQVHSDKHYINAMIPFILLMRSFTVIILIYYIGIFVEILKFSWFEKTKMGYSCSSKGNSSFLFWFIIYTFTIFLSSWPVAMHILVGQWRRFIIEISYLQDWWRSLAYRRQWRVISKQTLQCSVKSY